MRLFVFLATVGLLSSCGVGATDVGLNERQFSLPSMTDAGRGCVTPEPVVPWGVVAGTTAAGCGVAAGTDAEDAARAVGRTAGRFGAGMSHWYASTTTSESEAARSARFSMNDQGRDRRGTGSYPWPPKG